MKEPYECQFYANCGGYCETVEEVDMALCEHCLDAYHERESEHGRNALMRDLLVEMRDALKGWEATAWDGCPKRRSMDVGCMKACTLIDRANALLGEANVLALAQSGGGKTKPEELTHEEE